MSDAGMGLVMLGLMAILLLGEQLRLFHLVGYALVLAGVWWLLHRTRWGLLVRAATQDRETVSALGVPQGRLFTGVFALGCALAGLGGALQLPREPASLGLDLQTMGDAFVVVVVGGMGSIPGAYAAALLIAEIKALCIAIGTVEWGGVSVSFSKLTLVAEFVVMAVVLVWRPWGLMGQAPAPQRGRTYPEPPLRAASAATRRVLWVALIIRHPRGHRTRLPALPTRRRRPDGRESTSSGHPTSARTSNSPRH